MWKRRPWKQASCWTTNGRINGRLAMIGGEFEERSGLVKDPVWSGVPEYGPSITMASSSDWPSLVISIPFQNALRRGHITGP